MALVTIRLVRSFGLAALFIAAAFFGIASGVILAFVGDLPQISALDNYAPSTITRVLGRDGSVVGEFATERREVITHSQIPAVLKQAILAAEDADFNRHIGFEPTRMIYAVYRDLWNEQIDRTMPSPIAVRSSPWGPWNVRVCMPSRPTSRSIQSARFTTFPQKPRS